MNTEPIKVQDALRLCEMAIEDCDKATPEWHEGWLLRRLGEPDTVFLVLSRAVMRQLIKHLKERVVYMYDDNDPVDAEDDAYPPLAALRSHYDRVRPDWRVSK